MSTKMVAALDLSNLKWPQGSGRGEISSLSSPPAAPLPPDVTPMMRVVEAPAKIQSSLDPELLRRKSGTRPSDDTGGLP